MEYGVELVTFIERYIASRLQPSFYSKKYWNFF